MDEKEFFIIANSNAAPFFSDTSQEYVTGVNAHHALAKFIAHYRHPAGLFAARVFASADAYHKGEPLLAEWMSERAHKQEVRDVRG